MVVRDDGFRDLSPRAQAFVVEYVRTMSATAAAKAYGVKNPKTAGARGYQILHRRTIREAVEAQLGHALTTAHITRARILEELSALGTAQIADVAEVRKDGTVRIKPMNQWTERGRRAVQEISSTVATSARGDTIEKTKVKLAPKKDALELAAKICGHLQDVAPSGAVFNAPVLFANVTPQDIKGLHGGVKIVEAGNGPVEQE